MLRVPLLATAVVIVAIVAYVVAGALGSARKLAPLGPLPASGDYAVTLAFPPERFHQTRMQEHGRLVEVRDRTVYMRDVSPQALRDITREYWVTGVTAWKPA